jgi:hypothetical protein
VNTRLKENLQRVCQVLNECGVENITIGGAAVNMHGYERLTKTSSGQETQIDDLDFRYNPQYENYFKLLNPLEKLGQDVSAFRKEKAPDPHQAPQEDQPHFCLLVDQMYPDRHVH